MRLTNGFVSGLIVMSVSERKEEDVKLFCAKVVIVHGYPVLFFDPKKEDVGMPEAEEGMHLMLVATKRQNPKEMVYITIRFAVEISDEPKLKRYLKHLQLGVWDEVQLFRLEDEFFQKLREYVPGWPAWVRVT